jgi:AcrR family transcriptional regulator
VAGMKGIKAVESRAEEGIGNVEHNRTGPTNERASEVVRAAYALIVEKGMEGLRTREVADRVGINSATLHYYFPTKEALIQGVVEYLMRELRNNRTKPRAPRSALDLLRAEFADIRVRLKECPHQLIVLTELAVRGWRDPIIARMLKYLDDGWRGHLVSVLDAGIKEGVFRSDLDTKATAELMMSQLRGLGFQGRFETGRLDETVRNLALQTELWVLPRSKVDRKSAKR